MKEAPWLEDEDKEPWVMGEVENGVVFASMVVNLRDVRGGGIFHNQLQCLNSPRIEILKNAPLIEWPSRSSQQVLIEASFMKSQGSHCKTRALCLRILSWFGLDLDQVN